MFSVKATHIMRARLETTILALLTLYFDCRVVFAEVLCESMIVSYGLAKVRT